MPNKKENDSDTEETSERPSGSESDDDTDPEDHKGAAKKQQVTASSSEESDVSDAESDEEPAQKKTETKKSSDSKEVSHISLKKANEPSDNAPAKKSAGKKSSKKDVNNEKQDEKKVTIAETSGSKSTSSRGFGVRDSFGTLREKRKSKKAREAKDKEGIIQKKGNINRKWEKKYIIVSSASRTIYLYDLEPEQNERRANQAPKQVISLETAVIYARVQRRGAEMQSYFNIRANNRDYLFKAASPEEKSEWVAAIKSNKKKKEEDQVPIKGAGFQTPESQKKQDKNIEKASNIFLKLFGRESYLGVAKDS